MAPLVQLVFSIRGFVVTILAAMLWVRRHPSSSGGRRFLTAVVAFYSALSLYIVPYGVGRLLVMGFHEVTAADVAAGRTAIVLLGAESLTVQDWDGDRYSVLVGAGAARVLEAFRVYRLASDAIIVSSGGPSGALDVEHSDGVIMREALARLGVPPSRIFLETASRNTHDQAVLVSEMLRSAGAIHVVLVTSDTHMRRSLGAFRAQGVVAVPAIARDPLATLPRSEWFLPSHYGFSGANQVAHELLGLAYYAMRGWLRFQ